MPLSASQYPAPRQAFFGALLAPFQRLGVFFHTSFKMVEHDISIFLALFAMFFFNYGFAM